MKKTFTILLISAFLFNLFGYFPIFKLVQQKIQKEIKGRLKRSVPDDELFVFVIPIKKVNDLDWKRVGKEFKIEGTMYDIVKFDTIGTNIHYHCVNDKQETALFANLEDLVNQQMNTGNSTASKSARSIAKLVASSKYIPTSTPTFVLEDNQISANFSYTFFLRPVFIEIHTPPPNQHFIFNS